eukprot:4248033-Pyramimonas_sp.AAC.1
MEDGWFPDDDSGSMIAPSLAGSTGTASYLSFRVNKGRCSYSANSAALSGRLGSRKGKVRLQSANPSDARPKHKHKHAKASVALCEG